jgi:copper chaperone CopZ
MKNIFCILILAMLMVGCSGNKEKSTEDIDTTDQELVIAPENLLKVRFDVGGMTCTGCENTVIKGISELDGISEVTASHMDSVAIVSFDKTKATPQQMSEAIAKKGYEVLGHEIISESGE